MSTAPSNRTYLLGLALIASLGGFLFGYDTAVISGTIGFVKDKTLNVKREGASLKRFQKHPHVSRSAERGTNFRTAVLMTCADICAKCQPRKYLKP